MSADEKSLDVEITPAMVWGSPAIRRIIEEVRNPDHESPPAGYDRVYNRHNR